MIRKFNYTNRVRIKRSDVLISLAGTLGEGVSVILDLSKISKYGLPPESPVFLEAYQLTEYMRFECGEIKSIAQPKTFHLNQFGTHEGILFRIKVTKKGDSHKLIAGADAIPILEPETVRRKLKSLLPVVPENLGDVIYRISFDGDHPVLQINEDFRDFRSIATNDVFFALVYPEAYREILTKIYLIDKVYNDDDMDEWPSQWIRFTKLFPGLGEPPKEGDDQVECEEWIQRAVSVFARKHKTKNRFNRFWREEL